MLRDHSKGTGQPKKTRDYGKVWEFREVAREMYEEEFNEIHNKLRKGAAPGTTLYISTYQTAVKDLVDKLTAKQQAACQQETNHRNTATPSHDVQVKAFEKDGDKGFKKFARDVFRAYGIRVVFLCALKDKDDKVGHFM